MQELARLWGSNIAMLRKARGLTQLQLAAACEVEQASVSRWESGTSAPSDQLKIRIARALGADARSLFPLPTENVA